MDEVRERAQQLVQEGYEAADAIRRAVADVSERKKQKIAERIAGYSRDARHGDSSGERAVG